MRVYCILFKRYSPEIVHIFRIPVIKKIIKNISTRTAEKKNCHLLTCFVVSTDLDRQQRSPSTQIVMPCSLISQIIPNKTKEKQTKENKATHTFILTVNPSGVWPVLIQQWEINILCRLSTWLQTTRRWAPQGGVSWQLKTKFNWSKPGCLMHVICALGHFIIWGKYGEINPSSRTCNSRLTESQAWNSFFPLSPSFLSLSSDISNNPGKILRYPIFAPHFPQMIHPPQRDGYSHIENLQQPF